jgi:predicted N-acyltransferase
VVNSFNDIPVAPWNALTENEPLLSHAFFSALENSGSVGNGTGWTLYPIIVTRDDQLIGAMPLFLKTHSYGEYVFDWAWADAYQQSGLQYYPKLLSAIPFSPITGPRLLAQDAETKMLMIEAVETIMEKHHLSSAHVLFPHDADAAILKEIGWHQRSGVQFRWQNKSYTSFEHFLQSMSHNKRKKIHQERKKIVKAGVICRTIKGPDITEADWDFFYDCYCTTYQQHHSTPYLTRQFFAEISKRMPENILLIIADVNGKAIASTFNIYNQDTLYGRYWGATEFVSGLHFELCYYQAQAFCIAEKITYFEGGAQGEHKLARGFEPRATCSYHKIAYPQFNDAIKDFLVRESQGIAAYTNELEERVPFKAL